MDKPEFKHFEVTPVSPTLGGTIEGAHLSEISEDMAAELRTALWHYGVLFAHDQHLTPEQQKNTGPVFRGRIGAAFICADPERRGSPGSRGH